MITLTSLCSCLVTWSIGCIAPSSVSVMRDSVSSSVGPTASVSMLKPRRANRPGDAGQHARLVLDEDREDVLAAGADAGGRLELLEAQQLLGAGLAHRSARPCPAPAAPGAIIGYVFSSRVTRTSTTTGPGVASAVAQVLHQRRLVGQPHARRAVGLGELDEVRATCPCRRASSGGPRTAPATGGPCPGSRCS